MKCEPTSFQPPPDASRPPSPSLPITRFLVSPVFSLSLSLSLSLSSFLFFCCARFIPFQRDRGGTGICIDQGKQQPRRGSRNHQTERWLVGVSRYFWWIRLVKRGDSACSIGKDFRFLSSPRYRRPEWLTLSNWSFCFVLLFNLFAYLRVVIRSRLLHKAEDQ